MTRYIVQRLLQSILVMLLVSILVFTLLHLLPGGLVRAQLGPKASPHAVAQLAAVVWVQVPPSQVVSAMKGEVAPSLPS